MLKITNILLNLSNNLTYYSYSDAFAKNTIHHLCTRPILIDHGICGCDTRFRHIVAASIQSVIMLKEDCIGIIKKRRYAENCVKIICSGWDILLFRWDRINFAGKKHKYRKVT